MRILSRRDFLKAATYLGAGAVTWGAFPRLANAATSGNGTRVLFINLNGGMDGLYALQPSGGQLYSTLATYRPTLALNPASLLTANGSYGFHPNLSMFKSLYDSGKLSAVLNVGYKNMSRSHLDSEVVMARGVPDRLTAASSGFLNRLGAYNGWSSLQAMSVTGTDLAFEGGEFRGVQVGSLADFYFKNFSSSQERTHLVDTAYSLALDTPAQEGKPKLSDYADNLTTAADNTDIIKQAVLAHSPAVTYPTTQFGRALKDIDILFSSPELNTQVGYMRCAGFDTHSSQENTLDRLLLELNAALSPFVTSMQSKGLWNNLIVLVYSEFGRTNRENGSAGTDHGGANSMFLLGGAVQGGQIFGDIVNSDLTDYGWLQMKYNVVEIYRRIIARIGLDPDAVFAPNDGASLSGLFT